ncbi:ethanolamine ammonia-lyase light chain EutC [Secundilactobacillus collinoides]|uniref:ethanolamine ammonia-lyase light chain EutC n=1 Tax=Secundilactobacillus collinoides TaxID=33960 RepID=UPI002436319F|nr:ethanolamine ammonia-lyase light chain EutC [Secundilactobacillus collinoides]
MKRAYLKQPRVLIAVGDGLSSTAIEANVAEAIPAIKQGLALVNIDVGPVPFIRFARVATEDYLGEALKADVVCLLIGERPGLVTAKSMSAYIAYRPKVGMPESRRTVISNIHPGGVPAVEAGAYISEVIQNMLTQKASGLELVSKS